MMEAVGMGFFFSEYQYKWQQLIKILNRVMIFWTSNMWYNLWCQLACQSRCNGVAVVEGISQSMHKEFPWFNHVCCQGCWGSYHIWKGCRQNSRHGLRWRGADMKFKLNTFKMVWLVHVRWLLSQQTPTCCWSHPIQVQLGFVATTVFPSQIPVIFCSAHKLHHHNVLIHQVAAQRTHQGHLAMFMGSMEWSKWPLLLTTMKLIVKVLRSFLSTGVTKHG